MIQDLGLFTNAFMCCRNDFGAKKIVVWGMRGGLSSTIPIPSCHFKTPTGSIGILPNELYKKPKSKLLPPKFKSKLCFYVNDLK